MHLHHVRKCSARRDAGLAGNLTPSITVLAAVPVTPVYAEAPLVPSQTPRREDWILSNGTFRADARSHLSIDEDVTGTVGT